MNNELRDTLVGEALHNAIMSCIEASKNVLDSDDQVIINYEI